MKRTFFVALLALSLSATALPAREYPVRGPQGGLAVKINLPGGFDPARDRSELIVVEVENHTITRRRQRVVDLVVSFFRGLFC